MRVFIIIFACIGLIFSSCRDNINDKKLKVIAKVNGEDIYSSEIDGLIQQELYDELNRIYSIKDKALDSFVDLKLLQQHAQKENLLTDEYVDKYVTQKINSIGADSLYHLYRLGERTKIHSLSIFLVREDSLGERLSMKYNLKYCIIQELIDSLKKKSTILKFLLPPKNPNINLDDLLVFHRGKLDSKVTIHIISDFDCNKCIESHSLYDSIYMKYKDKVKFGYINFSTIPTLAQIACSAANEQGVFWQYYDSLYNQKKSIDSVAIFNIAKKIGLNVEKFQNDIKNVRLADDIDETIQKLVERGVFATPTVVINRRLIYNSNSYEEISHIIDDELNNN